MRDKWPCLLQPLQSLAMEFLSLYKENTRSMDCDEKHNEQYMVRRNIPFMKSICTSLWHESKYYSSELFCGFIFSCVDKSCWCAQIGGFRPMFQWQYAYNVSQLFSVCLGWIESWHSHVIDIMWWWNWRVNVAMPLQMLWLHYFLLS